MTKILVVVCAVVIGLGAVHASAQVPNVSVYFDEALQYTQANCPGTIGLPDTVYVVANNFGIWMSGIEYMIEYPLQLSFAVDIIDEDYLYVGTSPTGIGITFPVPAPAFDSFLIQRVLVMWNCESCTGAPSEGWPLSVVGYPSSGQVRAVEFGSNQVIIGVGMTSAVCATNPVVDETWGGIKALYQ